MPGHPIILCLNAGSSSLKFSVWDDADCLGEGVVEEIGRPGALAWLRVPGAPPRRLPGRWADHGEAAAGVFALLGDQALPEPVGVGHRLVHGGPAHVAAERVTPTLLGDLRALIPLAPLHQPSGLAGVEAVAARFPALPQAVCFDTAFHRGLPEIARRLALPRTLVDAAGIARFGFHGLSYEYVLERLGAAGRGRVVIAHLGNGASMAAVLDGRCIDTTMGFTPTGGLVMGTRCGDLDPGVLLYLLTERGLTPQQLNRLVNHESGLLGLSGVSSDMRELLQRRATDPAAALAVDVFCYQARKFVAALAAALGGLDTLVFTAGIGEHAAEVRQGICKGLAWLGVKLEAGRNARHEGVISADGSAVTVRVVPTNEELMIARHTARVLGVRSQAVQEQ